MDAFPNPDTLDGRLDGPALVTVEGRVGDAASWAERHRAAVEELLEHRRAVLVRGLVVDRAETFANVLAALGQPLLGYVERSTPRTELGRQIYTSTEYPSTEEIPLHNESSYSSEWPRRIFFCCLEPPTAGGETTIADGRRVYDLIRGSSRDAFVRRGVLYVRNYGQGVDLTWQDAFQTDDREAVERHCARADIECHWLDGGRRLRTRQTRPAALLHLPTGSRLWFNQAHLFHVSSLAAPLREALSDLFAPEALPRHAWYGDGGEIPDTELADVRAALATARITVRWQRGDLLLLDNLFFAHGRLPFDGPRRVVVAMAGGPTGDVRRLHPADAERVRVDA